MITSRNLRNQHRHEMFDFEKVEQKTVKTKKPHYQAFKPWIREKNLSDDISPKIVHIKKSQPQDSGILSHKKGRLQ